MIEELITSNKNTYDLNSLFMFSFNFDVLKQLITELASSQKRSNDNFSNIDDDLKDKGLVIEK